MSIPSVPSGGRVTSLGFFGTLVWLDGRPLLDTIEPYRRRIFTDVLDTFDEASRPRYNVALTGRAKKNWKTSDLILAALFALVANDSPGGNQCYLLANDEGQAGDDLSLAKKLIGVNPPLDDLLTVRAKIIERKYGDGFLMILPAKDVAGAHGKTYRFAGFDEIHGYRNWDLFEALALDPTRADAQQWITSYASVYHRPGVPLFDLCDRGWKRTDPRMLFSWYAADRTTDPDFAGADGETKANPSRASWANDDYLEQQQRRLPAHKYRRLHLNLPGLPDGSAFQPEPIMEAVERGVTVRLPEPGRVYRAFVDMSGGSNDDAVLAVGYRDEHGRAVVAQVVNQGPQPPFDPRAAVERFVKVLRAYGVGSVTGDHYAGETFRADFARHGIEYCDAPGPKSELYEALEPPLNSRRVILLDLAEAEQQLLGLVWRGGKIDHLPGEHDDWANAVAGVVQVLIGAEGCTLCDDDDCGGWHFFDASVPIRRVAVVTVDESGADQETPGASNDEPHTDDVEVSEAVTPLVAALGERTAARRVLEAVTPPKRMTNVEQAVAERGFFWPGD